MPRRGEGREEKGPDRDGVARTARRAVARGLVDFVRGLDRVFPLVQSQPRDGKKFLWFAMVFRFWRTDWEGGGFVRLRLRVRPFFYIAIVYIVEVN